ncbi:MAG: hypothetical protein V4629_01685 [Pseudomonadota bacterium]
MAVVTGFRAPRPHQAQTRLANTYSIQSLFFLNRVNPETGIQPLAQHALHNFKMRIRSDADGTKVQRIGLNIGSVITELFISGYVPGFFHSPEVKKLAFNISPGLAAMTLSLGMVLIAKSKSFQGLIVGTVYTSLLSLIGYCYSEIVNKSHDTGKISALFIAQIVGTILFGLSSKAVFNLRKVNQMLDASLTFANLQYENISETTTEITELNHPDNCSISLQPTYEIIQPVHISNRKEIYEFEGLKGWFIQNPVDPIERQTILSTSNLRRINPNLLIAPSGDENI